MISIFSFFASSTTAGSALSATSEPSSGSTMDFRVAPPAALASALALTRSSGLAEPRKTFSATLPNNHRLIPERPCVAMVISVSLSAPALAMITSAAPPFSTAKLTLAPGNV